MSKADIYDCLDLFSLVNLTNGYRITDFHCAIEEYSAFLKEQAMEFQDLNIARTYLMINKNNADIVAYMSLVSDSIKLSAEERASHFPESVRFPNFPAMKIGKLAVSLPYTMTYKNIGTLMIEMARGIAQQMNESVACKFITVDADIESNESVAAFYLKNDFVLNEELNKGKKRTVSMRLNIFGDVEEKSAEESA